MQRGLQTAIRNPHLEEISKLPAPERDFPQKKIQLVRLHEALLHHPPQRRGSCISGPETFTGFRHQGTVTKQVNISVVP